MALFGAAGDVKKPSHVETGSALMPLLYAAPSPRPSTSFRLSGGGSGRLIGGGAKKRWSRLSAPSEIHGEFDVLYLNDGRELLLFLQSMSPVPQGAV
jgi:hypothetical protein